MEMFLHLWDELDDVAGACRHVATSTVVEIAAVAAPLIAAAVVAVGGAHVAGEGDRRGAAESGVGLAATDPVYLRVLEDLRERIRGGLLAPGSRVPSRNAIIAR